jgi:hypothetical protein
MRELLKWTQKEKSGVWKAVSTGPTTRTYHVYPEDAGEPGLRVALYSQTEPHFTTVVRGWARTFDEGKQVAEEWEQAFHKYELPQVMELWEHHSKLPVSEADDDQGKVPIPERLRQVATALQQIADQLG